MSSLDTPSRPPLDSHDRLWIALSHLSLLFGVGVLLPLVIYLVKKPDSPMVADQSREALNFHLSVYLYGFISAWLTLVFIGVPILILLGLSSIVLSIIAAAKSVDGDPYRYPLTIRFIR